MLDYLKVFPEFETMLRRYTDEERGRLFMAMMAYAYRGEEPDFAEDAHEWYIWDTIKLKIDQCAETLESKRASGRKGGSTSKQSQAKPSKAKQQEADESNVKQNAYIQEQEQVKEQEKNIGGGYVTPNPYDDVTDDELRRMREEQADVEAAAKHMGLPASASGDFDAMDRLRAGYGAENLLKAINKTQGATEKSRCWRYVEGILRKEKERGYTWADKPPDSVGGMSYGRSVPKSHERDL